MKIQFFLMACLTALVLSSCGTDLTSSTEAVVDEQTETRNLGCIEDCNQGLIDCRAGSGQIGESQQDFYEYLQCRCPEGSTTQIPNPDCIWMGNNQNNPSALSCNDLYQAWADWQDECYIGYTLCIHSCESPTGNVRPKGDCDGDGIPNGADDTPGC